MIKRKNWIVSIALTLLSCMLFVACTKNVSYSCKDIVQEITSGPYRGRLVGTAGNKKAAAYIADAFKKIGLTPWTGDSYYQEYTQRTIDPDKQQPNIAVHYKDGTEETLIDGQDYMVTEVMEDFTASLPFAAGEKTQNGESIYISDDVVDAVQSGQDVCLVPRDPFRAVARLPETDDSLMIYVTPKVYARIESQGESADIEVHATVKESTVANVAGIIKGKDSSRAIVVSAHFDHMGWQGDVVYPGALDNASGVAALLATAAQVKALLGKEQPEVDLIFVACNSEEMQDRSNGMYCIGSTEFAKVVKPLYDSFFNINIDCVGGKESGPLAMGTSDETSQPLADELKQWMEGAGIAISDACYDCGDHISFRNEGIPAMVLGQELETIELYIHVPTDTADTLDYDQIGKTSTALAEFLVQKGENVFSALAEKDNDKAAIAEEEIWWDAARAEAKRLLGGRELKFDERYAFEWDGYIAHISGNHPFDGLEELHIYYPRMSVPEALMGYSLNSIEVWPYGLPIDIRRIDKKSSKGEVLNQVETIDLESTPILSITAVYQTAEDCLELMMSDSMEIQDATEVPLDGPYAGYSLQRGPWNNEGVYEWAVYAVGNWDVYLSFYHERTETVDKEDIVVTSYPTKEEMITLLDAFMAETSPEEIITELGVK